MNKKKIFNEIKKEVEELESSPLFEYREKNNYKPVIGEGSLDADVMFIGEAPGKNEAESGKPFVGSAGQILDDLIEVADINRDDVYITSVLFDRPPDNRNPKKEEIEIYLPYLKKLISLINPKIIVTLGNFAIKTMKDSYHLKEKFDTLRMDHGKQIDVNTDELKTTIFPTYHPAAMLYNRSLENTLINDFRKLRKLL